MPKRDVDDQNNYGPGSPTLTPESMTGNPADMIPGFMRPNPATGYPGAFNWAGMWNTPAEAATVPPNTGGRTTYPEDLYQSGLLPAPAANPVVAPAGSAPPAPAAPVDPRAAMLQKLTGSMTERGVGDFWNQNPDVAGGALRVNEGQNAGKVYAFLEPGRQSRIENNLNGLVEQWASTLDKILRGESVPTGVKTMMARGVSPANVMNAASGAAKTPAEIANLEATAGAHQAQASLAPAQSTELLERAGMYSRSPISERGANIGSMITNIYTSFMNEAAKVETDITLTPEQRKATIDSLEERARQAMNGISTIMGKTSGGGTAPGPGTGMTTSQFKLMAKQRGYKDSDIDTEMKLLLSQGKLING